MKVAYFFLAVWLGSLFPTFAQGNGIGVEISLEQDQILAGDEVRVAVRLTNFSGQTLHLGDEQDWLTFSVDSLDNFVVSKLADPPVVGEFALESSLAGTK